MTTGHCRHCDEDCAGGQTMKTWTQTIGVRDHVGEYANWEHNVLITTCPACVEAERVVAYLRDKARQEQREQPFGHEAAGYVIAALETFAGRIERGES